MFLPVDVCTNDTPTGPSCNGQLAAVALECDRFHHFYHYQSSAQYLWLGVTLERLGRQADAKKAYERAVFQDHRNEEARLGLCGQLPVAGDQSITGHRSQITILYHKHPLNDAPFCSSIGESPTGATRLHDEAVSTFLAGDYDQALASLAQAIAAGPMHSNSYFLRGKLYFKKGEYAQAELELTEAIRLSHLKHDAYHRFASNEHLARGLRFFEAGGVDIAINDFTKALDLFRHNKEALSARARAYRMKGSVALAEADEKMLM